MACDRRLSCVCVCERYMVMLVCLCLHWRGDGGGYGDPEARSLQCTLLHPLPPPPLSSPCTFARGLRPAGENKAASLPSPSSLSPDSCRLLTSRAWDTMERGGDRARLVCARLSKALSSSPGLSLSLLSLSPPPRLVFSLSSSPRTKPCLHRAAPTPLFSSDTDGGERPAIYRRVDMRTGEVAQSESEATAAADAEPGGEDDEEEEPEGTRRHQSLGRSLISGGLIPSFCHAS